MSLIANSKDFNAAQILSTSALKLEIILLKYYGIGQSLPKSKVKNLQLEIQITDGGEVVQPLVRLG